MAALLALGAMSLTWMALVAALIFAQKVLPKGEHLTWIFALLFVVAGIWVSAAPGTVPGLTLPTSQAANEARMRMMHTTPSGHTAPMNRAMRTRHGGKIKAMKP